ncbi:MAG TPA: tetratricopeptide repeat protein [Pirellulales bacterium]|nr:tetratricopeptide repeat protein [Pirellulales bacterium]
MSTFVWTEWVDPWQRLGVWVLLLMIWGASVILSFRQLLGFNSDQTAKTAEDLFRHAQREYLSGNWIKAEQLLMQLIGINGKDVDAQLMLASLLRRTGQLAEASERLRRITTLDGAEKWRSEIQRERQLLDDQFNQLQTSPITHQTAIKVNPVKGQPSTTKAA